MPHNRFYSPFTDEDTVTLSKEESLHLTQVMRHKKGDKVELCNGKGDLALCEVITVDKKSTKLQLLSKTHSPPPQCEISLTQCYLQPTHLELVIEKGTELGVDTFFLICASKSGKKSYSDNQIRRLNTIILNSMKQCGRLYLPKIVWLEELTPFNHPTFFGSLEQGALPLQVALPPSPTHLHVLIGPESGWTKEEEAKLKQLGAKPVTLHANILRAETAAIVALSQLATTL